MVSVIISNAALETGALLVSLLKERGIHDPASDNVVCYGNSGAGERFLNQNCMSNKVKRMVAMEKAGCSLIPWFRGDKIPAGVRFPLLARRLTGHGGTDIVPVFQRKEVEWRLAAGWDWFSSYVPMDTEYRVWVYRNDHLDTYEKVMHRPTDYKYIGRNFRNGFDFELSLDYNDATEQARRAIKALGLDFGAVDMLRGEDGKIYILEVNTAPGVIKSGAQWTLDRLVDRIENWDREGYPKW